VAQKTISPEAGTHAEPRLLALPRIRLPRLVVAAAALLAVASTAAIVFLALTYYPKAESTEPREVERRAAAAFGVPADGTDATIVGDLLVERFYAVDLDSGERYVGDMVKGRIQGVQSVGPVGTERYLAVLDLTNLQQARALYAAFVETVARPQGSYVGLRVFPGVSDAFRFNYDGSLPEEPRSISGPGGQDVYDFLLEQKYAQVSDGPRLVSVGKHNYVLNNTERFGFFRSEFRTGRALLLSELIIVDATATPQRATLLRLQTQYPVTSQP
jgi:hypothetical protein